MVGAFRVIDEDVGRRVIVDKEKVSQEEALALIDRAVRDATNGRFGGPTSRVERQIDRVLVDERARARLAAVRRTCRIHRRA